MEVEHKEAAWCLQIQRVEEALSQKDKKHVQQKKRKHMFETQINRKNKCFLCGKCFSQSGREQPRSLGAQVESLSANLLNPEDGGEHGGCIA